MTILKTLLFLMFLIAIPASAVLITLYIMIDIARNAQIREENNNEQYR